MAPVESIAGSRRRFPDRPLLNSLWEVIVRRHRAIALVTGLTVAAALVWSLLIAEPVYRARVLLAVPYGGEKPVSGSVPDLAQASSQLQLHALRLNTYAQWLSGGLMTERAMARVRAGSSADTPISGPQAVASAPLGGTNLIELRVDHSNRRLAAAIANAMAEEFIAFLSEQNASLMSRATDELEARLREVEQELARASAALEAFDREGPDISVLEAEATSLRKELLDCEGALRAERAEERRVAAGLARLEEEVRTMPQKVPGFQVDPVLGRPLQGEQLNPLWVKLTEEATAKRSELEERRATLAALEALRDRLAAELPAAERELTVRKAARRQLEAELERLQKTRESLQRAVTEARMGRAAELGRMAVVVVSPAGVPARPFKPDKARILIGGLVLGVLGGLVLAFLLEYLDYSIKSPADVRRYLGLEVLGTIPEFRAPGPGGRR